MDAKHDLKARFKAFAIAAVRLTEKLPRTQAFFVYEKQLIDVQAQCLPITMRLAEPYRQLTS